MALAHEIVEALVCEVDPSARTFYTRFYAVVSFAHPNGTFDERAQQKRRELSALLLSHNYQVKSGGYPWNLTIDF
jgi:hypothetical protein